MPKVRLFPHIIYTVMASHPGSTGEVVPPYKVMAGLVQLALTMNAGIVSRSRVDLFSKERFSF